MKKIKCVSYFVNRPILNVLVITERIINIVTPNQKIKAVWQMPNKFVCNYRELCDSWMDMKIWCLLVVVFQLWLRFPVNQECLSNNSE